MPRADAKMRGRYNALFVQLKKPALVDDVARALLQLRAQSLQLSLVPARRAHAARVTQPRARGTRHTAGRTPHRRSSDFWSRSSLIFASFLMLFARFANFSVDSDSTKAYASRSRASAPRGESYQSTARTSSAGEIMAIIVVLQLPPKESSRMRVNFESLRRARQPVRGTSPTPTPPLSHTGTGCVGGHAFRSAQR